MEKASILEVVIQLFYQNTWQTEVCDVKNIATRSKLQQKKKLLHQGKKEFVLCAGVIIVYNSCEMLQVIMNCNVGMAKKNKV